MNLENAGTILGIFVTAAGVLGWVFKVWIINPLSLSIAALDRSLGKMDNALDKIKEQSAAIQAEIARIDASTRSAHNRIDDLVGRVTAIERDLRDHD